MARNIEIKARIHSVEALAPKAAAAASPLLRRAASQEARRSTRTLW